MKCGAQISVRTQMLQCSSLPLNPAQTHTLVTKNKLTVLKKTAFSRSERSERRENAKEGAKRVCGEHFLVKNTVVAACQLIYVGQCTGPKGRFERKIPEIPRILSSS